MWNQKHLLTFAIAIGFACAIARGAAGPEKTSSDVNLSWKSLPADLPCPFAPASRAEMTELIETTMNVFEPSLRRTPIAITATTDPKLGGKGSFLNASKMDGGIYEFTFGSCMRPNLLRAALAHEISHPLFYAALERSTGAVGREWTDCLTDNRATTRTRCYRLIKTSVPYSELFSDLVAATLLDDPEAVIRETIAQEAVVTPKESAGQRAERHKRLNLRSFARACSEAELKPRSMRDSYTIACSSRPRISAAIRALAGRCGKPAALRTGLEATLSALNHYRSLKDELDSEKDQDIAKLNQTLIDAFDPLARASCPAP